MRKKIQVIAHRGLRSLYPENTLIAFEKAAALDGVDAIEFDVHRTSDGALVVIHDNTVDRCSDGSGTVREMTYAQLLELDFGSWKGPEFAGIRIPTLDQVLDTVYAVRPGIPLLIELKQDCETCTRQVAEVIAERGIAGMVMILSFHPRQLMLMHELLPQIPLQGFPERYLKGDAGGMDGIISKSCIWLKDLTAEEIVSYHRRGITVDTCPVDNAEELGKALAFDIDSITTNAPDVVLPLLQQLNGSAAGLPCRSS